MHNDTSIQSLQHKDASQLIPLLEDFWQLIQQNRMDAPVTPGILPQLPENLSTDKTASGLSSLTSIMEAVCKEFLPKCVNVHHPLFLAYVTPPSLDITWLGNAIIAMLNQNVSFSVLSPAGTAIEQYVIGKLCKMVGYSANSGGILVDGGSMANLQALITARRFIMKRPQTIGGDVSVGDIQRIYCSSQIHRSIHKAAIMLGIGACNVVEIPCDKDHRISITALKNIIDEDLKNKKVPIAIVGAAGTRVCGAFDDLKALSAVAEQYNIWLHVDGAFGAFLKLADNRPATLDYLYLAHSITLDPHKLLFMPFDSGCLLVRDRQRLLDAFGGDGEYLEKFHTHGQDFCDYGIQLARSMKAFNIWLAFKYVGMDLYKKEFQRLLHLAASFRSLLTADDDFEIMGPGESIIVCFRWHPQPRMTDNNYLDSQNDKIRTTLINKGIAFINGVNIENSLSLRVCFSNFNTTLDHLQSLLHEIKKIAHHK